MKYKGLKILAFLILIVIVFMIFKTTTKDSKKINYIALGDSLAEGMNSYGEINYGYADYLKDYLNNKNKLGTYSKDFAKSGYKTNNVMDDLSNNKIVTKNGKKENIRRMLRESDLVTISIGANDFISNMTIDSIYEKLGNINASKNEIKKISENVENLIIEVKKYAKNEIILIGYYNPFPNLPIAASIINDIVTYSNNLYKEISERQNIKYVDIYSIFDGNKEYLPNPYDIHPNNSGYEAISKEIVKKIKTILE